MSVRPLKSIKSSTAWCGNVHDLWSAEVADNGCLFGENHFISNLGFEVHWYLTVILPIKHQIQYFYNEKILNKVLYCCRLREWITVFHHDVDRDDKYYFHLSPLSEATKEYYEWNLRNELSLLYPLYADLECLFHTFISQIFFFLDCSGKFVQTKLWFFSKKLNENKCNLLEQNVLLLHYFIKWMRKKLFCGYWLLFTVIWSTHLKYFISQIQDKLCRFGAWAKTKRGWDIGQHPVGISTSKHGKRVYLFPRIHEIEDQPGGRCRPFCSPSATGIHTQTVLALTEQLLALALLEQPCQVAPVCFVVK